MKNSSGGWRCFWRAQAAAELRREVGGGIRSVSQGCTGMYYDGQADWSDSDWFGGLGEPMSRDC